MISRRSLFLGSAAVILTPGVLMPVRKVWVPPETILPNDLAVLTKTYVENASCSLADLRGEMTIFEYDATTAGQLTLKQVRRMVCDLKREALHAAGERRVVTMSASRA